MRISLVLISCIIIFGACAKKSNDDEPFKLFKIVNVQIPVDESLYPPDSTNNNPFVAQIKQTVLYKDKLYCLGYNGSLICLNENDFSRDTLSDDSLNIDTFERILLYNDTLFTQQSRKTYYWNSSRWIEYNEKPPVPISRIIYDDKEYTFYTDDYGEFGCYFFVYFKKTGITRFIVIERASSVVRYDNSFIISGKYGGAVLRNLDELFYATEAVLNPEKDYGPKSRRDLLGEFYIESFKFEIQLLTNNQRINRTKLIGSFDYSGVLLHLIESSWRTNYTYICHLGADTIQIVDSIYQLCPYKIHKYGKLTIFNEEYPKAWFSVKTDWEKNVNNPTIECMYNGFGSSYSIANNNDLKIIRNDTLFNISFIKINSKELGFKNLKYKHGIVEYHRGS